MKTKNHILALTSIVLVLFLFAPVLIRTLNGSNEANLKHFAVSATSGSPSKLDAQLPFEEREKEEEATTHSLAFTLLAILSEPFSLDRESHIKFSPQPVSLKCDQPRYLLIRSFLI